MTLPSPVGAKASPTAAGEGDSPLGERGEVYPILMIFAIWALLFTSLLAVPFVALVFSVFVDEGTFAIVRLLLAYCALAWAVLVVFFWRGTAAKAWGWPCLALAMAPYGLAAWI